MKYSIIIPVLNEEKNLVKIIPEIFTRLRKINFELIIVDDNSTDNTQEIIKKLAKKSSVPFRAIYNYKNLGIGSVRNIISFHMDNYFKIIIKYMIFLINYLLYNF